MRSFGVSGTALPSLPANRQGYYSLMKAYCQTGRPLERGFGMPHRTGSGVLFVYRGALREDASQHLQNAEIPCIMILKTEIKSCERRGSRL